MKVAGTLLRTTPNFSSISNEDTMTEAFRLAILECEAPPGAVLEKYGTYGDIVKILLTSAFETDSLPNLEVLKWNIIQAESFPNLDAVDGILLTGSRRWCYPKI